jgi:Bacterial Ig-like domain
VPYQSAGRENLTGSTSTTVWPDATNTGVPAGVTLLSPTAANLPAGVTMDSSGNLTVTKAGVVLSGLNITGTVTIDAANVTLENCNITGADYYNVIIGTGLTGVTVQNCTINNESYGGTGISGQGTFVGNNIMGTVNGINVAGNNTVIEGNYIHDMAGPAGAHFDTIQADGNFSNLLIQGNTLVNEQDQTSVLMLDNYWGPINNVTVDDNIMVGGDYTIYVGEVAKGQDPGGPVTNVTVENNHLGTGQYGYFDIESQLGDSPTLSNNVDDGVALLASVTSTTSVVAPPAAPTIASWSPDTGVVGDGITDATVLTLSGSAVAGGTVKVYDGSTLLGSVTASSTGAWSYVTSSLSSAAHTFTATDTVSGVTSAASTAVTVTVDTTPPAAPIETTYSIVNGNEVLISGTAAANTTIKVYNGSTQVGTGATNSSGNWSVTTSALAAGSYDFTSTATDAAGNVSALSAVLDPVIKANSTSGPVNFTNLTESSTDHAMISGVADPSSTVRIFDGNTLIGTTVARSNGSWNIRTAALPDTVQVFTAKEVNSSGTVVATSSGEAILGTTGSDVLTSTSGNDVFFGGGSSDTYVFQAGFGHDTIADAGVGDMFQFAKSEFANYTSLMGHASQSGLNTIISMGTDSLTLVNTPLTSLVAKQFSFV